MGKLIKLDRTKKRRDKKYNPYKNNPLDKQLTKALTELDGAIETDEKGAPKLDEAGKPIFKDSIEWDTNSAQIHAIWSCIKILLDQKLVPPNEIDAAFDLMATYARLDRPASTKDYTVQLPVNYFVGTWHILNTCRKFSLFSKDKGMSKAIDGLTLWFAEKIDQYHYVKNHEEIVNDVDPTKVHLLGTPPNKQKNEGYYSEGANKTVSLDNPQDRIDS